MDKNIIVGIAFVGIVIVVMIGFSSYYFSILEAQNITIPKPVSMINLENGSPVLGSESAPVTIVVLGDYQCESCSDWFKNIRSTLVDNYIETGKAKLVFLDLPFLGRDSAKAAQASYCAEDQGKYWEYHTTLYTLQEGAPDSGWANRDSLNSFALSLDMNIDEFNDCMDSSKYVKRVKDNYNEAISQGAQTTPSFIIISSDGTTKKFSGSQPYSVFAATIESML